MPRLEPTLLAAHIRRIAPDEALTDAELVGRYAEHRDAAAFEVLVWRHCPMVWATCRRILRHQHDIEDAFQATFLALTRAAGTLGTRQAVAGWLHRVAVNAALKLRADRITTGLAPEIPARSEPGDGELAGAVDEELDRLPDRIRAAFVLCCLEGMTNTEAARELGCPVGTVNSRLHAARARLRERLARRGFGPLAGVVLVAAPPASVAAAIRVGAAHSPAIAALARHAGRITTHGAITMKAGICAVLIVALAGAVWALGSGDGPSTTPKVPLAAPEVAVPPAPVTVWGEPVDGLQAGLRCPKRVLGPGESVEVELVLRNIGKYPVSFDYLTQEKGVEISGLPERSELRLGWSAHGGKPGMSPAYLRQDDEMVRGRVTLTHATENAIRPGSRIELAPGTYRVSLKGNPGDRLNVSPPDKGQGSGQPPGPVQVDFPDLKTGVLELVFSRDKVVLAAPVPRDAGGEGQIVLWRDGHPLAITPGAKSTTSLGTWFEGKPGTIRLGPDGKALIYVRNRDGVRPADREKWDRIYFRDKAENKEIAISDVSSCQAFWGSDGVVYGSGLAVPERKRGDGPADPPVDLTKDFVNWSFHPPAGGLKRLKLPGNVSILDRSLDGKTFLVLRYEMPPGAAPGAPGVWAGARLGLLPVDGGEFAPLTKLEESTPGDFRFSPDGRSALGRLYRKRGGELVPELVVFDLKTKAQTAVKVPKDAHVHASCWAPSGKQIAFVWEPEAAYTERMNRFGPVDLKKEKKPVYTVTVANPDGSDARDVYTETEYGFGSIDWAAVGGPGPAVPAEAAGPVAWGKAESGIRLGLSSSAPGRLSVTVENAGKDDTVVNLGMMLANGKRQFPTAVRLTITDAAGKSRTFERRVGPIAGRVDPFVVPLASGCGYALPCRLVDYADIADPGAELTPGSYKVTAVFRGEKVTQTNTDASGLALLPYWTGTARSGEVPLVVPETGLVGKWDRAKLESVGKVSETDGVWTIEAGKISETVKGRPNGTWAYRTDGTGVPREIDFIPGDGPAAGKVLKGIYKIEKDTLTVCHVSPTAADPDKRDRPTDFDSAKREDVVVLTLVRGKP